MSPKSPVSRFRQRPTALEKALSPIESEATPSYSEPSVGEEIDDISALIEESLVDKSVKEEQKVP